MKQNSENFLKINEAIEQRLTPIERLCAEQEHPYQSIPIKEIWINGKQVEGGYSSSSMMSIPWLQQDDELIPVRKAYSSILKDRVCFACQRFFVYHTIKQPLKWKKLLRFFTSR